MRGLRLPWVLWAAQETDHFPSMFETNPDPVSTLLPHKHIPGNLLRTHAPLIAERLQLALRRSKRYRKKKGDQDGRITPQTGHCSPTSGRAGAFKNLGTAMPRRRRRAARA